MNHVIIGNGVAGIRAAMAIRAADRKSSISVVSQETPYFFSRTALMYIAMGAMRLEDTEPFERRRYDEMNISLVHDRALWVDRKSKAVALEHGGALRYDRLLLATGSVPAMFGWPGADLEGVVNFVSCQDIERVMALAKKAKHAVIVGGGLIGIELAEVLRHCGIGVTFLIREPWFWPRALSREEGALVERLMANEGIRVLTGTELVSINEKSRKAAGVTTSSSEEIAADIVGITAGVVPDISLAKNSGIPADRGVLVNDRMETEVPGIYAAGDCAERKGAGPLSVISIWYAARDMGSTAGVNMSGGSAVYDPGPWYNSAKFFDLEYTVAGAYLPGDGDETWYREDTGGRASVRMVHRGGRVLGFSMIGSRWDHEALLRFIREGLGPDAALERLDEARFDAEFSIPWKPSAGTPGRVR